MTEPPRNEGAPRAKAAAQQGSRSPSTWGWRQLAAALALAPLLFGVSNLLSLASGSQHLYGAEQAPVSQLGALAAAGLGLAILALAGWDKEVEQKIADFGIMPKSAISGV